MPRPKAKPPGPRPTKRGVHPSRAVQVQEARSRGLDTSLEGNAEAIDPDKPPTDKQRLFAKLWASGESIVSATARAGYENCPTYGYRLARQPNIISIYEAEKKLYEEAAQMTRKKVMDMLTESYEYAKLAGEPASMVSAAREIGKMCGYYEPVKKKIELSVVGGQLNARLNEMSDSDLLKLITGDSDALLLSLEDSE